MEQKLLHGKVNSICGNVLFVSDNAGDFDDERIGFLKDFFKDKNYKVNFAEFVGKDDIRLDFTENGVIIHILSRLKKYIQRADI